MRYRMPDQTWPEPLGNLRADLQVDQSYNAVSPGVRLLILS